MKPLKKIIKKKKKKKKDAKTCEGSKMLSSKNMLGWIAPPIYT